MFSHKKNNESYQLLLWGKSFSGTGLSSITLGVLFAEIKAKTQK